MNSRLRFVGTKEIPSNNVVVSSVMACFVKEQKYVVRMISYVYCKDCDEHSKETIAAER